MNAINEWAPLGEFTIESGRIILKDPCYYKEGAGNGMLVKKGQWKAITARMNYKSWGTRNALLIAYHIDHPTDLNSTGWTEIEHGGVGVDSGQAGIFDITYYGDEAIVTETIQKPLTGENKWYDLCCDKTLGEMDGGVIPFGCVASSGIGDGYYKTYSYSVNDTIVALAIDFDLLPPINFLPAFSPSEKTFFDFIKNNKISKATNWVSSNKGQDLVWFYSYCLHTDKDDMLIALINAAGSTRSLDFILLFDHNKRSIFEKIKHLINELPDSPTILDHLCYSSPEDALYWSRTLIESGFVLDDKGMTYLAPLARLIDDTKIEFLKFWVSQGMKTVMASLEPEKIEIHFANKPVLKKYLLENYKTLDDSVIWD